MPDDKRFVPDFQLVVDGAAADPDLKGSVLGIRVTDDMDKSSRFWVHLSDAGRKWTKQSKFKPGTAIEIKLGYQGLLKSVCKGEVSNLEMVLATNGPTRLIVSGVDKGHGFDKGTLTKTYKDVKDSDLGGADCAAPRALRRGGRQQGGPRLRHPEQPLRLRLPHAAGRDRRLPRVRRRQEAALQEAEARGPGRGQADLEGEHRPLRAGGEHLRPGLEDHHLRLGSEAGEGDDRPRQGRRRVRKAGRHRHRRAAGEADVRRGGAGGDRHRGREEPPRGGGEERVQQARRRLRPRRGAGHRDPAIRAGSVVEVEKAGKRVDGQYYVVSTDHVFFVDTGYATEFRAKRYTIKKGSSPAKDLGKFARSVEEAAKKAQEIAEKIKEAAVLGAEGGARGGEARLAGARCREAGLAGRQGGARRGEEGRGGRGARRR